jgi:hypothetical protein
MATFFTVIILVIRLQIVKLSLEACIWGGQEINNPYNIELNRQLIDNVEPITLTY